MKLVKYWPLFIGVCVLSACGGGSGSSSSTPKTNQSPVASISGPTQMDSGASISLTATASDPDGSIAGYTWSVEPGSALTLGDSKTSTLSITAGSVAQDTDAKLTLTVTDNQGASTQTSVQLKIVAKKTSLSINGLVTDAVVPNANVTATIRDLTFTTTADANGKYTLDLSVDDAHLSDLVLITADGGISKPWLKLVSQLPSMKTLSGQAGEDKKLDLSENFSVNITNLTTAQYALMVGRQSFYGIPYLSITNDLQLKNIKQQQLGLDQFVLAALIKSVVDGGFTLPSSAKTTLDLVLNRSYSDALLRAVDTQDDKLIYQIVENIKQDPQVNNLPDGYAGKYILYADSSNVWEINFTSPTRGQVKSSAETREFSWEKDNARLTITLDTPIDISRRGLAGHWVAKTFELRENFVLGSRIIGSGGFSNVLLLDENNNVIATDSENGTVNLVQVSDRLTVDSQKLVGEWIFGNSLYAQKWTLKSDGTLETSNLDGTDSTSGLTWLPSATGFQTFRAGELLSDVHLIVDEGAAYSTVEVVWKAQFLSRAEAQVNLGTMIKSQANLSPGKESLKGHYLSESGQIYTLADDNVIVNFASRISPWDFDSATNSWTSYVYQQGDKIWLNYCDLVANKACSVYKKRAKKLLGIGNGIYYLLNTDTTYDMAGMQAYKNYQLEKWSLIPYPSVFGYWIQSSDVEFFQQTNTGTKVWRFNGGGFLEISDKSKNFGDFSQETSAIVLLEGKLFYTRDNVERVLELLSLSDEGMTVCEYKKGEACTKSNEIVLTNRSPAAIGYKVTGSGSIQYDEFYVYSFDSNRLFGNVATFTIVPNQGYTIESVTGCGGKLEGFTYATAPVRDKCTITANFVKASP